MDGAVLVGAGSQGYRKRCKKGSRKERVKEIRYSNHFTNAEDFRRPCKHNTKAFKCVQVTKDDIIQLRKKLHSPPVKRSIDEKISHLLLVSLPKSRTNFKHKQKVRTRYILKKSNGEVVKVCQKFFLSALRISQRNVITISKKILFDGEIKEKRGGDRRKKAFQQKRNSVKSFIENLEGKESHYNRLKSKRIYLAPELNISKLWRIYNTSTEDANLKVNLRFFYDIFVKDYNVGFGTPAIDVCGTCARLQNIIQHTTDDPQKKSKAMLDKRIHKLRAKQFHLMMADKTDDSVTFAFDLQQVHALPKINIQDAFYLRKFALYNFCITNPSTTETHFYTWTEDQAQRGSNEIGSAVYDFLNLYEFPEDCDTLKLFADGCGGQNKNSSIVHMLMYWLRHKSPPQLQSILLCFPVRGHSFLPADRVFGRLEKILRKQPVILTKEDYWKFFKEVANTVHVLGDDWKLYNLKNLQEVLKKTDGIKDTKRIYITKSTKKGGDPLIKMEVTYRNDDPTKKFASILKRGRSLKNVMLNELDLHHELKTAKVRNVQTLLQTYDEEWKENESLSWYKTLIDNRLAHGSNTSSQDHQYAEEVEEQVENSDGEECECCEEDVGCLL